MNEHLIQILIMGSLFVLLSLISYLYHRAVKSLNKAHLDNKNLEEENHIKSIDLARFDEQIKSYEKLLENINLEKKIIEQELSIKELTNKNIELDKDLVKTNQKFDTKFEITSTELKDNSEKIGLLYGNSQNQGNFGEYSLDLVFNEANYIEGHNYFRQKSFSYVDTDGKSRNKIPDFIVPRPLKGDSVMYIIIDAKTPLTDFKEWHKAKKANEKQTVLDKLEENFIKKIYNHASSLVRDNYQSYVPNAFSKIIMFVPIEDMRTIILNSSKLYNFDKKEQTILEYLFKSNIWISSRSDILNTLDMVREMYDKKNQTDNINAIVKVARDIAEMTINVIIGANKYIEACEKATNTMRKVITLNNPSKHLDKLQTTGMADESIGLKNVVDKYRNQKTLALDEVSNKEVNEE